jgi:hypothetical protein
MKGQLAGVAAKASIQNIEAADVVVSQSWGESEATLLILGLLRDRVAEEDHLAIGTMFCNWSMGSLLPLNRHVSSVPTLTNVGRILAKSSFGSDFHQIQASTKGCALRLHHIPDGFLSGPAA